FTAEPFERGFGTTVGNSLRRILLSSLEGAAVTQVKIKGADHEFSSLSGVTEDVTDIILNIKSLIVKLDADEEKEMRLVAKKAGPITAGMIEADPSIILVNKDHVIATLTEDQTFDMTLTVGKGRGYVTALEHREGIDEQEAGLISVDSIYSPVTRVRYATEDARVGHKTDADLRKFRSFGKTGLREVKRKLADLGLSRGMDIENLAAQQAAAAAHAEAGDDEETEEADTEAASS